MPRSFVLHSVPRLAPQRAPQKGQPPLPPKLIQSTLDGLAKLSQHRTPVDFPSQARTAGPTHSTTPSSQVLRTQQSRGGWVRTSADASTLAAPTSACLQEGGGPQAQNCGQPRCPCDSNASHNGAGGLQDDAGCKRLMQKESTHAGALARARGQGMGCGRLQMRPRQHSITQRSQHICGMQGDCQHCLIQKQCRHAQQQLYRPRSRGTGAQQLLQICSRHNCQNHTCTLVGEAAALKKNTSNRARQPCQACSACRQCSDAGLKQPPSDSQAQSIHTALTRGVSALAVHHQARLRESHTASTDTRGRSTHTQPPVLTHRSAVMSARPPPSRARNACTTTQQELDVAGDMLQPRTMTQPDGRQAMQSTQSATIRGRHSSQSPMCADEKTLRYGWESKAPQVV
jgi:hypothetical protein